MMDAQPFSVTVTLRSPPIFPQTWHAPTLDALLSYARYIQSGEDLSVIRDLPLQCTMGVFHGSVPAFAAPVSPVGFAMAASFGKEDHEGVYKRGRGAQKVDLVRGPFQVKADRYEAFWTVKPGNMRLTWFGCGDPDAVIRLLQEFIPAIGKRNNKGFGEVLEWESEPRFLDEDESWVRRGFVMRPIPVDVFRDVTGMDTEGRFMDNAAWQPSYFHSPKARCVLPNLVTPMNPMKLTIDENGGCRVEYVR